MPDVSNTERRSQSVLPSQSRPSSSTRRPWIRRVVALLLGCSAIAFAEWLLGAVGLDPPELGDDPYVEFAVRRPLFELNNDEDMFVTSEQRLGFFRRVSFPHRKQQNEFRVFVIGGSTVQGHPYSIETSFPSCLQAALNCADTTRTWNVINCGGVSYASYRLVPVLSECLNYDPDLIVFCEGHNEFLEDVTYAPIRSQPASWRFLGEFADRSRIVRMLRKTFRPSLPRELHPSQRDVLTEEVDAILNHEGGLNEYRRDDFRAAAVADHFRLNLQRMIKLCADRRVPLLVVRPPSNLADCPPFKSQFSDEASESTRREVSELLSEAQRLSKSDLRDAISAAKQATELDPRYALSWYELGQLQLLGQQFDDAKTSLLRACDEDVCPLRMTSILAKVMTDVVLANKVAYVDANRLLESKTASGILGDEWLVDHVHPSFVGNEEIGIAIAQWMAIASLMKPDDDRWEHESRRICNEQLQSLDDLYFLKGRQRLELLRRWAAGRATEVMTDDSASE